MRLTRMTDYALRLLMYLGQNPERLCTIAEVASAYGVSEAHLMKVTHQLGTAGWIETVRGKGGGIRLAQPASEVRLGLVMRGVERDFNLVECFSTEHSCTLTGQCRLAHIIEEALADFLKRMDQYTLEDILTPPQPNQHRSPHPND